MKKDWAHEGRGSGFVDHLALSHTVRANQCWLDDDAPFVQSRRHGTDVFELVTDPTSHVVDGDYLLDRVRSVTALRESHLKSRVQGPRGQLHVERVDADRVRAQLLVGARRFRKDEYARALVDHRTFLRDEVHSVENRIYQKRVIAAIGGDRLVQIFTEVEPCGCPVLPSETRIDAVDRRSHDLEIVAIRIDILSRRLQ